jgi:uncharacterized membrane protein
MVIYKITTTWAGDAYEETNTVEVCEAKFKRIEAILNDKCSYCQNKE